MFIEKSEYKKLLEEIETLIRKNKEFEDIISGLRKQIEEMDQELTFKELLEEDREHQVWINTHPYGVVKKIVFTEEGEVVIKYNSNSQVYVGEETQVGIDVHDKFRREK
ncbi:MAG: hypothetical protein MSA15_20370 [Clostridium sp.]|nr:hypothetical protein [Clostridium sp.]